MSLSYQFARRYLFGKKSTNVINVITGVSVAGIAVGSCALILVLSVFNGFHDLLYSLFNSFNPPVKILPIEGKVFDYDESTVAQIKAIPGVLGISATLEETAMFEYNQQRDFGTIKGVDESFAEVSDLSAVLQAGDFTLQEGNVQYSILGAGVEVALGVDISNEFEPLKIHMPKRKKRSGPLEKSFVTALTYPHGIFSFQHEFDKEYVITSLQVVRDLLGYEQEVSAYEIRTDPNQEEKAISAIQQIVGKDFRVLNRYQQEEAFLKVMNMEKWMAFSILCLTILLVAFNLIGALWMIVLDKQKDIIILKTMGAGNKLIRNIFLKEGLLITGLGLGIGIVLALLLYGLQVQFGLVPIREGFIVDSYPISVQFYDILALIIAVVLIGFMASLLPSWRANQVGNYIREE